uniref:TF_AP-2 domain-containing protein n=1 Tax=Caenorhabditis tropicalis TaxID=1561998 RepID=A0A1I7TE29_9PELO
MSDSHRVIGNSFVDEDFIYRGIGTTLMEPQGDVISEDLSQYRPEDNTIRSQPPDNFVNASTSYSTWVPIPIPECIPTIASTITPTHTFISASTRTSSTSNVTTKAASFGNRNTLAHSRPIQTQCYADMEKALLVERPEARGTVCRYPIVIDAIPEEFISINSKESEFDAVGTRFGMGTSQKGYYTTVEEMRRRIEGPEKLNSSNMACNLKRPKLRNGGDLMRTQLKARGIELMLNCRQVAFPNKIIPLIEAEAINLASDLGKLVDEDYPVDSIAKEAAAGVKNKNWDQMNALADKMGFSECMEALESVFTSVVPPMTGVMPVSSENKNLNRSMENFSCVTHGLGVVTSRVWVRQMAKVGKQLTDMVEEEHRPSAISAYNISCYY